MPRHRVASIVEFRPESGREVTVADRVIAVFRIKDEFFALDGICPHAGGPLGKGFVTGNRVTCPWHGWQFDVTNGRHCLNAHVTAETFPVVLENGEVYVEIP